jgi:hypothetical protein
MWRYVDAMSRNVDVMLRCGPEQDIRPSCGLYPNRVTRQGHPNAQSPRVADPGSLRPFDEAQVSS